jgi:hypothetical protein
VLYNFAKNGDQKELEKQKVLFKTNTILKKMYVTQKIFAAFKIFLRKHVQLLLPKFNIKMQELKKPITK